MKKAWIVLSIFPIMGFSQLHADDFFYFSEDKDEALCHIASENEESYEASLFDALEIFEEENDIDLSLIDPSLEMEEKFPWEEEMSADEITSYAEKKAGQMTLDYDDVFAYEAPAYKGKKKYAPTKEQLPEGNRHFFSRPRVVHAKPDDESNANKKKKHEKRRLKRPSIADKKAKQPKTVAKTETD